MTHISPSATLSWAIYSVMFEGFLLSHLYQYDRFRCLRWTRGGAFKTIMTMTYLSTVPLLMCYSIAFAYIKYNQGLVVLPTIGIHPKPSQLWPESRQHWISPLYFIFAIGWSFEIVTHMEEFTFWLFLLQQDIRNKNWFSSYQFKIWILGSLIAVAGMPLLVYFTRSNPLRCEAWIFLVGSAASTTITILFLYILWTFPSFLRRVKNSVSDRAVLYRLQRVHRLNIMRVIFRFLFTLPLLCLAVDGLWGEHRINENFFLPDFFVMLGGLACIISSGITLLIFFPLENQEGDSTHNNEQHNTMFSSQTQQIEDPFSPTLGSPTTLTNEKIYHHVQPTPPPAQYEEETVYQSHGIGFELERYPASVPLPLARSKAANGYEEPIQPARKSSSVRAAERSGRVSRRPSALSLHPYIATYTSPIELVHVPQSPDLLPRAI